MTLVLSSDYYLGVTMPCGFNGDSVDFDSVAVESEFCAGDWALPSPVCAAVNTNHHHNNNNQLHNLDMVGDAAFGFAAQHGDQSVPRRSGPLDVQDSSLVSDDLKSRLLGGDSSSKMETDDFDVIKRDRKQQQEEEEPEEEEEEEELFFQPPRRISMLWNSKLRWKEERKKVLKISISKLRRIEDPELFLCRSVLVNNTVRRLHKEIREEKMARYPEVHRPVPVGLLVGGAGHTGCLPEAAFPCRKRPSPSSSPCYSSSSSSSSCSSSCSSSSSVLDCKETATGALQASSCCNSNKENLVRDEQSDLDGAPPGAKRLRTGAEHYGLAPPGGAAGGFATNNVKAKCDQRATPGDREDKPLGDSASQQQSQHAKERSRSHLVSEYEKQYSQYSCGQLSIFGELQSVVFHSLIASLES